MLRLLLLTLLLLVNAATSDNDGSGDNESFPNDDEDLKGTNRPHVASEVRNLNEVEDQNADDGSTTIIIIAGVVVVALTIVAVIAVVLFKRHLQIREQGVYSVPVEQGQKAV